MEVYELRNNESQSCGGRLLGCLGRIFTFLFIILVVLFISNPDESKLRNKLKSEGLLNVHNISTDDFGIISFYGVRSVGINGSKERYYIGIASKFVLVKEGKIE